MNYKNLVLGVAIIVGVLFTLIGFDTIAHMMFLKTFAFIGYMVFGGACGLLLDKYLPLYNHKD